MLKLEQTQRLTSYKSSEVFYTFFQLEDGLSEEARCPICRQSFYNAEGGTLSTGQTSPALMSHMALHCSEVAPLSRQSAKNIIQSAEVLNYRFLFLRLRVAICLSKMAHLLRFWKFEG